MSLLSVFLGSLLTLLSVASAIDIPDSIGEKESNVSSISSVFLPPSLSVQHPKDTEDNQRDPPSVQSDKPPTVDFHEMEKQVALHASLQKDNEKLEKQLEDRKATYEKNKKKFDETIAEDEKELAKMGDISKELEEVENELKEKENEHKKLKTSMDEAEKELVELGKVNEELQKKKSEVEKKNATLKDLTVVMQGLESKVLESLGECFDVPQKLKEYWGDSVHEDTKLCVTSS